MSILLAASRALATKPMKFFLNAINSFFRACH
jgi:hypothetical protein